MKLLLFIHLRQQQVTRSFERPCQGVRGHVIPPPPHAAGAFPERDGRHIIHTNYVIIQTAFSAGH